MTMKRKQKLKHMEAIDGYWLYQAEKISQKSKDPSTKVGAVLVDFEKQAFYGYNRIPVLCNSNVYNNREKKYDRIIHAEMVAIFSALEKRPLKPFPFDRGETLYVWPFHPCKQCAKFLVEFRISRVISLWPDDEILERWKDDLKVARQIFGEAGTEYLFYERSLYETHRNRCIENERCNLGREHYLLRDPRC